MKKLILLLTFFVFAGCAGNAATMRKEMVANPVTDNMGRIVFYRPDALFAGAADIGIMIDGEAVAPLSNASIFYKDVDVGEYDVEIANNRGGDVLKVKVNTAEIVFVKMYSSERTRWTGTWNIEQIKPKRAINEIKAL